jgi:hypothetical protein
MMFETALSIARERLTCWRALQTGHVQDGRELFRQVLDGPIRFRPDPTARVYHFAGEVELGRLFEGIAAAPCVASPSGTALLGLTVKPPKMRWLLPRAA